MAFRHRKTYHHWSKAAWRPWNKLDVRMTSTQQTIDNELRAIKSSTVSDSSWPLSHNPHPNMIWLSLPITDIQIDPVLSWLSSVTSFVKCTTRKITIITNFNCFTITIITNFNSFRITFITNFNCFEITIITGFKCFNIWSWSRCSYILKRASLT